MRSPICRLESESRRAENLSLLLPPHKVYVEPLGGNASVLFAKEPSALEVYNGLDPGVVNFFRTLRDPEKFSRLYNLLSFTPYSREEFDFCRSTWKECSDEVERARRWFVAMRQSFGEGWHSVVSESKRGMAVNVRDWLLGIEMLPWTHQRIREVQIDQADFREIFERYDSPETFFLIDLLHVDQQELTLADCCDLVSLLLKLKGRAILSGYRDEVCCSLEEAGWKRVDIEGVLVSFER